MAVRIASYAGDDGADLGALISSAWLDRLGGGSWFPVWDHRYVHWRLLDPRIVDRELIVCAYDEDRLVGCVVGEETRVRAGGAVVPAALVSYLSHDPSGPGRGVPFRMVRELEARLRRRGVAVGFGVTSDAPGSVAKRFWDGLQRQRPQALTYLAHYTCWVRVCDPAAVSRAGFGAMERFGARLNAMIPWGWVGRRGSDGRRFAAGDLASCRRLIERGTAAADVAMIWSDPRLSVQLDHPQARSVVLDGDAGVQGLASAYLIDWAGAAGHRIRVGFLELCFAEGMAARSGLLVRLGRELQREGAQMVVMMDAGTAPRAALLLAGFTPIDPHVRAMALFDTGMDLGAARKLHWAFT
jgi:hypothetical protein